MIDGRRVLALITARGGSKRLPGKNVRPFAGRPLIAWSVAAARGSAHVDRVVVTSDDPAIIAAAVAAGAEAPFVRPPHLSTDAAGSAGVALHALEALEAGGAAFDLLVLLQPTSPLRTAADIDACLALAVARGAPVVAVAAPLQNPNHLYAVDGAGQMARLLLDRVEPAPAAGGPGVACVTGAVYVIEVARFRRDPRFTGPDAVAYVMPPERSIDIDTELEFRLAEFLLSEEGAP